MTSLAIAVALLAPSAAAPAQHHGRVVGVIDGDTLPPLTTNKRQIRVRLSCIDAPEKKQAFGARSERALSNLVFDKDVTELERDRDRCGEPLAMPLSPRSIHRAGQGGECCQSRTVA